MLLGLAILASAWLLVRLWEVLLVVTGALMLVGALNPLVERLEKRGISRGWGIAIVFMCAVVVISAFTALTIPSFATQVSDAIEHFPDKQRMIAERLEHMRFGAPLARSLREINPADFMSKAEHAGLTYGPRALELFAYFASAVFLSLYLMIDRDRMRGALFALVPRSYHVRLSRVLVNLETIVGGYVRGQLITSAMMAVFTFAVLSVARVPNALALSLFAGIADVLPYVGALLACGPAFFAALAAHGTTDAVVVLGLLAAYQEFESRVIVPRVYGKVLRLPASSVLLALLVGGKLLGILGALLSLPIAAAIRMLVEELRVDLPGESVPDSALRAKDEAAEREFAARAAGEPAVKAAAIAVEIAEERRAMDGDDREAALTVPITGGETH